MLLPRSLLPLLSGLALLLGPARAVSAPPPAQQAALAVLERHQCNRCHQVEGLPTPPREKNCAACHQWISGTADDPAELARQRQRYPSWDRFVARTGVRYVHLPALAGLSRFRPAWLTTFLKNPYDLRPHLAESMIQNRLTDAEIETLVKGLSPGPEPRAAPVPTPERLARGERLFNERSCGTCHRLGNRSFEVSQSFEDSFLPTVAALARAPDLRHARHRLRPERVAAYIADPASQQPGSRMPRPELEPGEAELLAEFVLHADLGKPRPAQAVRPAPLPASTTAPRYEEVEAKVFRWVCWHCHSNPDYNGGDGGPGNTGGLGFPAGGLSFGSYEEVMAGSVGPDGKRRSIFRKGPSGEPVLVERLRQRYAENDRDFVHPAHDDLADRRAPRAGPDPGMPLGLPALSDEQLSLVERWVKHGRPAPEGDEEEAPSGPNLVR